MAAQAERCGKTLDWFRCVNSGSRTGAYVERLGKTNGRNVGRVHVAHVRVGYSSPRSGSDPNRLTVDTSVKTAAVFLSSKKISSARGSFHKPRRARARRDETSGRASGVVGGGARV